MKKKKYQFIILVRRRKGGKPPAWRSDGVTAHAAAIYNNTSDFEDGGRRYFLTEREATVSVERLRFHYPQWNYKVFKVERIA